MRAAHERLLVGSIFANAARAVPERPAIVLGADQLTFGELERRGNQLAWALAGRGVRPGERVATLVGSGLELAPLFVGLARLGAVFVPCNPGAAPEELETVLRAARPRLVVADAERAALGVGCAGAGLEVADLAALNEEAEACTTARFAGPDLDEDAPHVIFFTSGSTGRPKGVVLSHRVNVLRSHPGAQLEPRGAMVCPFPLFHMSAWTIALQQWQARDRLVLVSSTDAATICAAVGEHRAARINGIPAVWQRIIDHARSDPAARAALSHLRFADTGTSATPIDLLLGIEEVAPNAHLRVFYGSTEAGGVTCLEHGDVVRKPGSCGTPAIWTEISLGEEGELLARSPLLFSGYFDDPEATAATLSDDGWFHTGDRAAVDEDGFVSIVGRTSQLIRSGGEWVAPSEVESVLTTHPDLADVAVVGLPDERWGEIVCAAVVPAAGRSAPSLEALRAHCEGRLASFKHPRAVVVLDAIPRTPATGQVQRRLVTERCVAAQKTGR